MKFLLAILLLLPTLGFAQHNMKFYKGSTRVTLYNYDFRVTAEQRYSDKVLQVVVIPQSQGIHFDIRNVQVMQVPPSLNITGPAVEVQGIATVWLSQQRPTTTDQAIPVQVALVSRFSMEEDKAHRQGYTIYHLALPKMLSR